LTSRGDKRDGGGVTNLDAVHLVLVSMWGGVLLTEIIVEALGVQDALLAARLHFWIDVFAELPIVLGVLVTGALLTARIWPPTGIHLVKVGTALAAVGLNLYCGVFVILHYRHRHDPDARCRYRAHVLASSLGFPFGAAAAYIGLSYFT
jgi:hypothetical protein